MVVCPACGERATLETYEAWTPKDGWKKLERISCNNVRPKNGDPCGKKTVLKETRLEREATPVLSTEVATPPSRRAERSTRGGNRHAEEQPEQPMEPNESPDLEDNETDEEEVEVEVESQSSLPHRDTETVEQERPARTEQPGESTEVGDEEEAEDEGEPSDTTHMLEANGRRFPKYSADQYQKLIDLVESGMTCPQAAQAVGIQVNTAYGIIGKYRRGIRGQAAPRLERRPVLTLVPPRTSVQVRVPVPDVPFKTSTLLSQLKAEGIDNPGRLLSSPDLEALFQLPADVQEGLRLFHAMRHEVAVAQTLMD